MHAQHERVTPDALAFDRPSTKFLGLLKKYFGLKDFVPQNNNFVVFDESPIWQMSSGSRGSRNRMSGYGDVRQWPDTGRSFMDVGRPAIDRPFFEVSESSRDDQRANRMDAFVKKPQSPRLTSTVKLPPIGATSSFGQSSIPQRVGPLGNWVADTENYHRIRSRFY
jgi:hypothetical protein